MSDLSRLLKESWTLIEDEQDTMAGRFYSRLFLSQPHLRDLFPVHLDVHRARLLAAIVKVIQDFDDPHLFGGYLRSLGRDHRKFQVTPQHYPVVRDALLDALRTVGGQRWCLEYQQAWRDAYDMVANAMIAGAATDTDPPYWLAEVIAHERRGPDVAVFTCRTDQPMPYRAGQYVSLECGHRPKLWRTYSIANAPNSGNTVEFHVRSINSGWVSGALVRLLRPGDVVKLAAPMGSMTLDRASTRDIVCVAGGTGLAPLKALVDELTRYNRTRWVHLFVGARTREDLYDLPELAGLAARYPWISLVPAVSDDPGYPGERGPVADVLARYGPWADHDVFVSGSPGMMRATLRRLSEIRVPSTRIRYDIFSDT